MCEEYNGWVNRETWAVHLHLSNDEALYRAVLDLLEPDNLRADAESLERWVEVNVERQLFPAPDDDPDPWGPLWRSMIADVGVGSFYRVDWDAVVAAFAEDVEEVVDT